MSFGANTITITIGLWGRGMIKISLVSSRKRIITEVELWGWCSYNTMNLFTAAIEHNGSQLAREQNL